MKRIISIQIVSSDCCEPIYAEIKQTTSEDREPETKSDRMHAKQANF